MGGGDLKRVVGGRNQAAGGRKRAVEPENRQWGPKTSGVGQKNPCSLSSSWKNNKKRKKPGLETLLIVWKSGDAATGVMLWVVVAAIDAGVVMCGGGLIVVSSYA